MTLSAATQKVEQFQQIALSSQRSIISALNSENELAAAFAQADARRAVMVGADNEVLSYLVSVADKEIGMVEVIDSQDCRPNNDAIGRVMVIALMNGFIPGRDQFSVFGKRNGEADLYVKKKGYDVWFAHLTNCTPPDVKMTFPVFKKIGKSDRACWAIEGTATCVRKGKTYSIEHGTDNPITINGYQGDQITSIKTKAKRAFLKELWELVTLYSLDKVGDNDDDEDDDSPKPGVTVLTPEPTNTTPPPDDFVARWRKELTGIGEPGMELCAALFEAWKLSDMDAVESIKANQLKEAEFSDQRIRRKVELFCDAVLHDLRAAVE